MSTFTVTKAIAFTDPDSDTVYDMQASIELDATVCYRDAYTLSASTSMLIFQNGEQPFSTGKVVYVFIHNTGDNSAYIAFQDDGANGATQHEIPAGSVYDFFGQDIWGNVIASPEQLSLIYAKGDTTIEVDIFM